MREKKSRSCAYPVIPLAQAIELVKKLFENIGAGPHSRDSVAKGLGYTSFSGAASAKIGALAHFGLLSRLAGRYTVTPLAQGAFSYPNETSIPAIALAAQKPVLYQRLIARFTDEPLPKSLDGILVADYGITKKAAPNGAANFAKTMEFAGLVNDGKLVLPGAENQLAAKSDKDGGSCRGQNNNPGAAIKIKLASGIEIIFPEHLVWRLSMGDFAPEIKNLDQKASQSD